MKRLFVAIIAVMVVICASAQNKFGVGLNAKSTFFETRQHGVKSVTPSLQLSYEVNAEYFFALETAVSFGYRYAEGEKTFSNGNPEQLVTNTYVFKGHTLSSDVDVYLKLKLENFQVIAGFGYAYRKPTPLEGYLEPVADCSSVVACYGYACSGIKASAGLGYTLFKNIQGNRLDVRGLLTMSPYNDSDVRKIWRNGFEISLAWFM